MSQTVNGTTTSYTYNAANELTNTGYAFDANGNQTASPTAAFTYNAKEQTTAAGSEALGYSGPNQWELQSRTGETLTNSRLGVNSRTVGTTTSYFTRDPDGSLVSLRVGGATYYYAFDGLGSVVGLTDSTGSLVSSYKYDPYGGDAGTTGTIDNPFRYASGYYAASLHLYKFGLRWYDPATGRWTQQDAVDDATDTHGWNRYPYVGDDPVNYADANGANPSSYWWWLGNELQWSPRYGQIEQWYNARASGHPEWYKTQPLPRRVGLAAARFLANHPRIAAFVRDVIQRHDRVSPSRGYLVQAAIRCVLIAWRHRG